MTLHSPARFRGPPAKVPTGGNCPQMAQISADFQGERRVLCGRELDNVTVDDEE